MGHFKTLDHASVLTGGGCRREQTGDSASKLQGTGKEMGWMAQSGESAIHPRWSFGSTTTTQVSDREIFSRALVRGASRNLPGKRAVYPRAQ